MNDFRKVLEEAIESLQHTYPAMPKQQEWTGLEICVKDEEWEPADMRTWRSWTGRRKIWGIEHHGPIYVLDSKDDSAPFTGKRICMCEICQKHVDVTLKPN